MLSRSQLYESRNEERSLKVFRKGDVDMPTLKEHDFQGIAIEDQQEYRTFFERIWLLPILHNSRSTNTISNFWKEAIRLSFLASKSGVYQKTVILYGTHQRQKFTIFSPIKKEVDLRRVVMFLHGGFYVNGAEEAFQYLAKDYVEAGYIFVTVGFRQLPKYTFYDSLEDTNKAFKQVIDVVGKYGGNNQDMCVLTWSSSALMAYANLFQNREFYDQHISCMVNLGTALHRIDIDAKIVQAMFDNMQDADHLYPNFYFNLGPLPQKLILACGSKGHEFQSVYESDEQWVPKFKQMGYDVKWVVADKHDHYDLIRNTQLGLSLVNEAYKQIDQNKNGERRYKPRL